MPLTYIFYGSLFRPYAIEYYNVFFNFYQRFLSQTLTIRRTAGEGRGGDHVLFHSTTSTRSRTLDIYLQLCMWDDYNVFLIATLVFTRLLLDEIYHLIELPFDWLIDWLMMQCLFFYWIDELILGFLLQRFDMGNRWIWTRIDFHPCITSEPTNQVG